mgnify:CR=1 FL=1
MLERVRSIREREYMFVDTLNEHYSTFSRQMIEAVRARLEAGEQVVILHNRRGFSTFIVCASCGAACQCPQ